MSLIDELKAKNQMSGQTQNIQELYTIQPEKWITLYKWTEDITKRVQRIDYKVSEQISKEDILNILREEISGIKIKLETQMMKYQEELKKLQKAKVKHIFKGIPIGIVIGMLVTLLWIR